ADTTRVNHHAVDRAIGIVATAVFDLQLHAPVADVEARAPGSVAGRRTVARTARCRVQAIVLVLDEVGPFAVAALLAIDRIGRDGSALRNRDQQRLAGLRQGRREVEDAADIVVIR